MTDFSEPCLTRTGYSKERIVKHLSFYLSLLCSMFIASPLALADTATPASPVVVLKAAHIFDSVSGKLADHGVVVVQDGKILAVGADSAIPAGARVIDLGDATRSE